MLLIEHDDNTSILKGLQFDDPMVFIPWNIGARVFETEFQNHQISCVTDGYYTVKDVRLFDILVCNVGFYFDTRLNRIEFFRNDYSNLQKSFNEFQTVFEANFGKPSKQANASTNYETYEWNIRNKIKIHHYVMDRFGLTEYLFILNM